jgi:hypothetical protein
LNSTLSKFCQTDIKKMMCIATAKYRQNKLEDMAMKALAKVGEPEPFDYQFWKNAYQKLLDLTQACTKQFMDGQQAAIPLLISLI